MLINDLETAYRLYDPNTGDLENIEYNLIKKGIDKEEIQKGINSIENEIPDLELRSAEIFARKRKLGKYSLVKKEKEKELAKMSRAGFSYSISLKALGYN